jgi:hypothetical protein
MPILLGHLASEQIKQEATKRGETNYLKADVINNGNDIGSYA